MITLLQTTTVARMRWWQFHSLEWKLLLLADYHRVQESWDCSQYTCSFPSPLELAQNSLSMMRSWLKNWRLDWRVINVHISHIRTLQRTKKTYSGSLCVVEELSVNERLSTTQCSVSWWEWLLLMLQSFLPKQRRQNPSLDDSLGDGFSEERT